MKVGTGAATDDGERAVIGERVVAAAAAWQKPGHGARAAKKSAGTMTMKTISYVVVYTLTMKMEPC
jgi:hypothetical protein